MLFCCACSDSDIELNPATQAKQQLAMTFRCGAMSPTRAATDDTRIDDINLYLFPANGDPARHLYIAPVRPVVLELPKGDYTLYAIANLGHDAGERTQDFVRTLHVERDPAVLADAPFPMSAQQSVTVRGDTQIAVSLHSRRGKGQFQLHRGRGFRKVFPREVYTASQRSPFCYSFRLQPRREQRSRCRHAAHRNVGHDLCRNLLFIGEQAGRGCRYRLPAAERPNPRSGTCHLHSHSGRSRRNAGCVPHLPRREQHDGF